MSTRIGGKLVVGKFASDPASPENGLLYYNTTTNELRVYKNGSWSNVASGSVALEGQALLESEIIVGDSSDESAAVDTAALGDVLATTAGGLALKANSVTNAKVATGIDAAKLADGSVSNAKFQYINSLTSNAQDQIDGKADTVHTHVAADVTDFDTAAQAASISQAIANGVTDKAPSEDAVFDALAGKANSSHTHVAADVTDFTSAARTAAVADAINDGTTNIAPSQNAVFDALAGKANSSHTHVAADVTDFDAAAQAASISQVITNGVTDKAPSEDAVFDALALKADDSDVTTALGLKANDADVIKKDGSVAFTGDQSMGGFALTNLLDPVNGQDAATKAYALALDTAMGQYVDSVVQGLKPKASVRAATVAAGTLATSFEDGDVIDGVTLAEGDRILIKDQAAAEENGIYVVEANGAPSRALDFDALTPIDEINGAYTIVAKGTQAGKSFVVSSVVATIDTSPINFVTFSSAAGASVALDNLSATAINVDLDPGSIGLLDLGNNTNYWRDLYLGGFVQAEQVKSSNTGNVILDIDGAILNDTSANEAIDLTLRTMSNTAAEVLFNFSGANPSLNTHKLTGVVDPTDDQDAATKKYVDDEITAIDLSGFANTTLSNLGTTAINTSLIPSIDSYDLGSISAPWVNLYVKDKIESNGILVIDCINGQLTLKSGGLQDIVLDTDGASVRPAVGGVNLGTSGFNWGTIYAAHIQGSAGAVFELNDSRISSGGQYVMTFSSTNLELADLAGVISHDWENRVLKNDTSGDMLTYSTAGSINMHSNLLENVLDPVSLQDAATKNYVDTEISGIDLSSRANTALSNLASVAVNTDFLPGADNTHNLGASSLRWSVLFAERINDSSSNQVLSIDSRILRNTSGGLAVEFATNAIKRHDTGQTGSVQDEYVHSAILDGAGSAVVTELTFADTFAGVKLCYTIKEDVTGKVRHGTMHIACDGTNVDLSDIYTESNGDIGVTWAVAINAGDVELTATVAGANDCTMRADIKRISA